MAGSDDEQERELYRFPEFFDRLEQSGELDVRDGVESETEVDGLVYHHRGVQVPAYQGLFVQEPADGESVPAFSLELGTVGPRNAWARFDARKSWDLYLVLFAGGAVVAWMSDAEYEADEAETFPSKAAAVQAGRFSFGTFFRFGPDWVEREEWAMDSDAPAMIEYPDGRSVMPESVEEYVEHAHAMPVELRPNDDRTPPDHLGLLDVGLSVESSQ